MSSIDKYILNLEKEFVRSSFDNMQIATSDEKLLYLYCYYHFFNADNSKIIDILQGSVYDSKASDRISGIYIDSESDACDIDAVIAKYVDDDEEFDFPILLKALKDAENLLMKAIDKQTVRGEIKNILSDEEYSISAQHPLKIRLVTNFNPQNVGKKRIIMNALQALKPERDYITFEISFGYDVEFEILEIENPKEFVDAAIITIDSANNYVTYGKEKSLLVNISAKSLQELYEQYGYRGLFAQNLRYYVKNARIDESIVRSIQENSEHFWYLNNGVIIICDDYEIDGNVLLLKNFSIINGGQTTKLIGEAAFENDFFLQCKIVKNMYDDEAERVKFIASVAEASNTQKPIKEKDLIANKPEQRLLKKQLAESGIYCQIKRGEKVNKKLYPAAWQNTTNEELGQFLLSFVYQKPGIARSSKASICGNKERYSLLFGKTYNSQFLGDLLKIKAYYKFWMNYIKKNDDGSDPYKIGLVNNGMLLTTGIVGFLAKIYYHPDFVQAINDSLITEQKIEVVSQHDIDHRIFLENLEKNDFFDLFELCYRYFYRPGYEFLKSFKGKYNNYSNFTKVDNNYKTYVFRQMCAVIANGIPDHIRCRLDDVFYAASTDDLDRDRELLSKYVNVVSGEIAFDSDLSEEVISEIKEELTSYRTRTFKLHRIKAYEVFKNEARDRIAKAAPINVDDLRTLKCLDEAQLELYGEDIVGVVNKVLSNH